VLVLILLVMVMVVMVLVLILLIMVMVMMVLVLILLVMVMVVMVLVLILLVMVMVMMVLVLILLVMVMVVMVLVLIHLIMVMMVVVLVLILVFIVVVCVQDFLKQSLLQISGALNGIEDHFAVEFRDGCRDDGGVLIVLAKELHTLGDFFFADLVCPCQDDSTCIGDLVIEEFAKILEIDFALGCVYNCCGAVEVHLRVLGSIVDGTHNVRELADTGGLDQDALGSIGGHDFPEGGAEITDQRAADAACVHLTDLNAGLFKESAVNTDLTEFVFDQNDFRACKSIFEKLFNECRLAGTQESGNDIYFCHCNTSCSADR
jgi:hypothetical protein